MQYINTPHTLLWRVKARDVERQLLTISARLRPAIRQPFKQGGLGAGYLYAPSTANQQLSMLEASGQIAFLEPWFSNRTKSIHKSPKLYLADTGLLRALLNIHSRETLLQAPSAGVVWETFVFAQLRKREHRAGRTGSLFF